MSARCLAWLLAIAAFALTACDGGNGDDADTGGGTGGAGSVGPTVDEGCSAARPKRSESGTGLAGFFRACASEDGSSLEVINTSSAVLVVSVGGYRASVSGVPTGSVGELAVAESVPSGCNSTGQCWLPPAGHAIVDGPAPVRVSVELDPSQTAIATGAAAFGNYVVSKLQTRAQRFVGSITACAQSVSQYLQPNQYAADAIRAALNSAASCQTLVTQVAEAAREAPPPPTQAADDAFRLAGRFTQNLRRDLYVFGALRLVAAVR